MMYGHNGTTGGSVAYPVEAVGGGAIPLPIGMQNMENTTFLALLS